MPSIRRFTPASEWAHPHQLRGLWGERVALAYLTACGWDIEAHRFRLGHHDIDLVARRDDLIAFVEVKTRHSAVCGSALESVSRLKQRLISRVALLWRLRHGRPSDEYRFDLVAVQDLGAGKYQVDHVADAWRLEWSAAREWLAVESCWSFDLRSLLVETRPARQAERRIGGTND